MEIDNSSLFNTQVVLTVLLAVVVPLWLITRHYQRECKLNYPPGPKGNFVFGNALDLPDPRKGGIPEEKQLEWSKEYGLFYTIVVPVIGRIVIVMDPELAKKVLITKNYNKSFLVKAVAPIVGSRSMGILNGAEWSPHRRAFNPGFAPSFLKTMVSIMVEKLSRFMTCIEQDISNKKATHMLQRAQTFTSDVIASTAFGEDWGGNEPHQARIFLSELMSLLAGSVLNPLFHLTGTRFMPKICQFERLLDHEMLKVVEKRLTATSLKDSSVAKDICSIAIDQMKGDKKSLSQDDKISITHQLKTFYFAGHDTTASLIAWTVWLLSQNASVVDKIRQELKEHDVWVNTDQPPSVDQLQRCIYLEAVLKETLRLYPPGTFITRESSDETETYKGFTIGGCVLGVNIYGMHRHPALWKEPERFRPERFLDGSEGDLTKKYIPFSRGPRDCIGKHFAMLEGKLAVSALVSRYNIECVDPNEKFVVKVTGMPQNGALVVFSRRE